MIFILIPTTKERRPRLKELIDSIHENTQGIDYSIVTFENHIGWVRAHRSMLNRINGYCVLLADDLIVKENWLQNLWNSFVDAFPAGDGIAEPFNEIHGPNLSQHPLGRSDTILKYLHKGYIHNYSDNEFTDRARADGKLIYVPTAIIEHKHWTNGKAQRDETYLSQLKSLEHDKELYESRKRNNFQ